MGKGLTPKKGIIMDFKFDAATFAMIQDLVFPLVKTLTGFDPAEWAGEKSELFIKVGDGFADVSALFLLVGTALEDGKLSEEEITAIIADAKELPDAIDAIVAFFEEEEAEEPVVDPEPEA